MIQIKEVLELTQFKNFRILCGRDYLTNTVNTAVILEYESSRIHYAGYCYGYFVLLSYFFATTNPDLVHDALKTLIEKHVSGIAIKIHPDEHIPLEIIQLALENKVPLLTFYDEFMEDLIVNINESLKTRAQYIIFEQKLNSILSGNKDPSEIEKIALEINPEFKKRIICANFISKEKTSNLQVHTYFDNLMYHRTKLQTEKYHTFIKSGQSIILVASIDEDELKGTSAISYLKNVLVQNGFTPSSFNIGYSKEIELLPALDKAVKKAQTAASVCAFQNSGTLEYSEVGIYKYALSIVNDKTLNSEVTKKMGILTSYDAAHEANLIKTLVSFVNNNGDYSKTSEECYQHTNTIRYRIKKAEQLLELEEKTADEEITLLIRCHLISEFFKKIEKDF